MNKTYIVDRWLPEFEQWEQEYQGLRRPSCRESALIPVDDLPILFLALRSFSGWNYAGASMVKDTKVLRQYLYDQMTDAQQAWCDQVIQRFGEYVTELQGEPE